MKIFLDSANLLEIKKADHFIDGVTTNPTLIKESNPEGNTEEYIKRICQIMGPYRPVNLEVFSTDTFNMIKEARILFDKFNKYGNVVVKVPITPNGLEVLEVIKQPINITLVMTEEQALLVAKKAVYRDYGATYVSIFMGRIDDYGQYGDEVVTNTVKIFKNYNYKTKIIAASVRKLDHVKLAALAGADIITVPFKILQQMFDHPKTKEGIERFTNDTTPEYKAMFDEKKMGLLQDTAQR